MKIATFNVNGIRAHLPQITAWLKESAIDVAALQEIKCAAENFPGTELEDLGYNVAINGQKGFNGVAILSKRPIEDVRVGLPGDEDNTQARYLEVTVGTVRIATIYLPNGNPVESEKYPYKLAWMEWLRDHAMALLEDEDAVVLGGDYNICATDADVYDPLGWADDALCRLDSRRRFREIVYLGYTDAFRALHADAKAYSFWDYQGNAWPKGNGLLIDHLLLSPRAADRLLSCEIDSGQRGQEKPSDHVPVWCELSE
jgi:exodeoxyribonuclease-3